MEHLHKLQIETRKDLDVLRLTNNSLQFPHWLIFGGITILPIIIGIAIFLSIFSHRTTNIKLRTIKSEIVQDATNQLSKTEPKEVIAHFKNLTVADIMNQEVHH